MDKVIPLKFNVIIVQVSLVMLWCQHKQSMMEGWTDWQTMDETILTLVTHNNNYFIVVIVSNNIDQDRK